MKKIGIISDTHSFLDENIFHFFKDVDEIWHAGDIGSVEITDKLAAFKPLKAVYGNIDDAAIRAQFPLSLQFEIEGCKILLIHIAGAVGRYNTDVQTIFKNGFIPNILVCGHSHIAKVIKDPKYNFLYINSGAAGVHGFHKIKTIIRFEIENGKPQKLELIELGWRGK